MIEQSRKPRSDPAVCPDLVAARPRQRADPVSSNIPGRPGHEDSPRGQGCLLAGLAAERGDSRLLGDRYCLVRHLADSESALADMQQLGASPDAQPISHARFDFVESQECPQAGDPREPRVHLEDLESLVRQSPLQVEGASQAKRHQRRDQPVDRRPDACILYGQHLDRNPVLQAVMSRHSPEKRARTAMNKLDRDLGDLGDGTPPQLLEKARVVRILAVRNGQLLHDIVVRDAL